MPLPVSSQPPRGNGWKQAQPPQATTQAQATHAAGDARPTYADKVRQGEGQRTAKKPNPPIEEMLQKFPDHGVCLVDHQQMSQLNKSIDPDRIVGVIDHHALQRE